MTLHHQEWQEAAHRKAPQPVGPLLAAGALGLGGASGLWAGRRGAGSAGSSAGGPSISVRKPTLGRRTQAMPMRRGGA